MPMARLKYDSGKIKESIIVSNEMIYKIRERSLQPDMNIIDLNIDAEVPQDMEELLENDLPAVELPTKRKREYSSKDKNHKRVKISKKDMVKKAMENPVHGPRFGIDEGLNGKRRLKKKEKKVKKLDSDKYLPSDSVKKQDTKLTSENGLNSLIRSEPQPVQNSSKPALNPSSKSASKQKLVTKNEFSAKKLKILVNDSIERKELVPIPKKKK
jgi:hypothetical protein